MGDGIGGIGEAARIEHLARRAAQQPEGGAAQATAQADPPDPEVPELRDAQHAAGEPHDDVERPVDLAHQRADGLGVERARHEQAIGPGLAVQIGPAHGFRESLGMAGQVGVRARVDRKGHAARVRRRPRGADSVGGLGGLIERRLGPVGRILQVAAHGARGDGPPDGLGHMLGFRPVAGFDIGAHRQVHGARDARHLGQHDVPLHGPGIRQAERERDTRAGGRQRPEALGGQQLGAARVPGIGQQEDVVAFVQPPESLGLGVLCG